MTRPIPLRRRLAYWWDDHGFVAILVVGQILAWAGVAALLFAHRNDPPQPADPNAWAYVLIAVPVYVALTRPSDYAKSREVDNVAAEVRRLRDEVGGLRAELRRANEARR